MRTQLSEKEVDLVRQLRALVIDILEGEYEVKDDFLIKWLRHANHDVKKAEQALRNHKKWRVDNNIGTILSEDTKELEYELPIELGCLDREGYPVIAIKMDRDARAILAKVGKERYVRYMIKNIEHAMRTLRQQHFLTGGVVNHFSVILDMDGFTFRQVASAKATSAYTEIVKLGESNYPLVSKNLYVVNAPFLVTALLAIIKPFLSSDTISRLMIFDTNKVEWKEALLKDFEEDQFPSFLREAI